MKTSSSLTARLKRSVFSKAATSCALGLTAVALLANMAIAQKREVPILLYGPVETTADTEFWVSKSNFSAQMQELKSRGYTTITIADYVKHIKNPTANPIAAEKPVILTFINGYKNALTVVDPILDQHGFKAANFILPAYIGGTSSWDVGNGRALPHLNWSEVNQLDNSGRWEIGSHTRNHARLLELTEPEREAQIAGSKSDIESKISGPVRYFSYPYGAGTSNADIRARIQNAGYEAAFGVDGQDPTSSNDLLALPRLYVTSDVSANDLFGPRFLNESGGGGNGDNHPADNNTDGEIDANELSTYAEGWLNGDHNDADKLSIGAEIWLNGGKY